MAPEVSNREMRMRTMALLVLAALAAGSATADAPPPPPVHAVVFAPGVSEPDGCGTAGRFTPVNACDDRREGRALIRCHVAANRTLDHCMLVSEVPRGEDFGAAALRMAEVHAILAAEVPAAGGEIWLLDTPFRRKH